MADSPPPTRWQRTKALFHKPLSLNRELLNLYSIPWTFFPILLVLDVGLTFTADFLWSYFFSVPAHINIQHCPARLPFPDLQAQLFTPSNYSTLFNAAQKATVVSQGFTHEQELCDLGFQGDARVYGAGLRGGLYAFWVAALIANHTLREFRRTLQKVWAVVAAAIVGKVMALTLSASSCTFAIEIVILYIAFWGGLCAVSSMPNINTNATLKKWQGLKLETAVLMGLFLVMICHAVWFFMYGYDRYFAFMPCGITHLVWTQHVEQHEFHLQRMVLVRYSFVYAANAVLYLGLFVILFWKDIGRSMSESAICRYFSSHREYMVVDKELPDLPNVATTASTRRKTWRQRLVFLRGNWLREPVVLGKKARLWVIHLLAHDWIV